MKMPPTSVGAGVAADGAVGKCRRAVTAVTRPPPALAELPLMVQLVSVAVPLFHKPPPAPAELPLTVTSVSVIVPSLYRPPPVAGRHAAADRQARNRRRDPAVDLEHADRAAAADRHARCRALDRLRPTDVVQLELALRQRDRLRCGEDGRVEGDRLGAAQHIGQVDGLAQAQVAQGRCSAVERGIDHQSGLSLEGADVGGRAKGEAALVGRDPGDRRA